MAEISLVPIWGQMGTSEFLPGRATQARGDLFWGQRMGGQEDPRLLPELGRREGLDHWGSDRIPQQIGIRGLEGIAIAGW